MKGKIFNGKDLRIGQKVFFVSNLEIINCKIIKISDEKFPCYTFSDEKFPCYTFESDDLKDWSDWAFQSNFFRKASKENSLKYTKVFLKKEEAEKQLNHDKKHEIKNLKSEIKTIQKEIIKIKKSLVK